MLDVGADRSVDGVGPRATVVLVHGAGHTASVWDDTRVAMAHPSVAVDLPGRGHHPAELTTVSVADAAASVAAGVDPTVTDVVLVAHSVSGTILPTVAALLGSRVRHVVFVAGITAPEGTLPREVFLPGRGSVVDERLGELRRRHRGRTLEEIGVEVGAAIDSLNFASQPMAWCGLPESLGRTFVRCLRDPIQPRALQNRLAVNCGATDVVDLDSGHTPALDVPVELAGLLDAVADRIDVEAAATRRGGLDPASPSGDDRAR